MTFLLPTGNHYFNPRSPHGERLRLAPTPIITSNFNPRSPHGERPNGRKNQDGWNGFQSTLPARGATPGRMEDPHDLQISIHAPRTGSDRDEAAEFVRRLISIHAPRTGSDKKKGFKRCRLDISIHAPRTGSDRQRKIRDFISPRFQSTLPARGATERTMALANCQTDFNPRSPHGERPVVTAEENAEAVISIHAPRTGSDVV